MKVDRFWAVQFVIVGILLALLIGSYLFSFGLFSPQPNEASPPPQAEATPASKEDSVAEVPAPVASCVPQGAEPTPSAIGDSLASNDPARQQNCLAFLQAESKAGDKGAELWLGRAYHNGWGVNKDLTQAASHYQQAATANEADIRESAQQWLLHLQQGQ
jgi:TPR repeat protein